MPDRRPLRPYRPRWDRTPALPLALAVVLVWVGCVRILILTVAPSYPPSWEAPPNVPSLYGFADFWFVRQGGLTSVQGSLMAVNLLWCLWLWARLRALPRGTFATRSSQLVTLGGAALLLAYLQRELAALPELLPGSLRAIVLDPATGSILLP